MQIINEYYHVYSRGAHKASIFLDGTDYHRFLCLLYIANNTEPFKFSNLAINKVFSYFRKETYVDILAYCLMPNHFHLVMREKSDNSISHFMHKLSCAYSMYYNLKHTHSGTIFQGPYKSKHVGDDDYLRYLIQYVHLNPFGIQEPDLSKIAKTEYFPEAIEYSRNYEYSSFKDYLGENRQQKAILAVNQRDLVSLVSP